LWQWINLLLVVAFYQFLVFAPVILGAGALFFVLGQLAVTTHDAATWIYGDGVTSSQEHSLSLVRWTGQSPWLRATLFLTLFALLERVVRISTDPQQRERVLRDCCLSRIPRRVTQFGQQAIQELRVALER
jgi:hypothetical protein